MTGQRIKKWVGRAPALRPDAPLQYAIPQEKRVVLYSPEKGSWPPSLDRGGVIWQFFEAVREEIGIGPEKPVSGLEVTEPLHHSKENGLGSNQILERFCYGGHTSQHRNAVGARDQPYQLTLLFLAD